MEGNSLIRAERHDVQQVKTHLQENSDARKVNEFTVITKIFQTIFISK